MKKLLCAFLAALCLAGLSGCARPNSQQLDLYRGYGDQLKLLHLNASSQEKETRMAAFLETLESADPLEKDFSLFAYYPDYKLELAGVGGKNLTAIVDINGEYIDFYFPGPEPEAAQTLYRSHTTAEDFKKLVHQE